MSPDIGDIARSRASAYRFLDDNREDLLIPAGRDFFVADLYDARKRSRQNLPLPRQIVLQYAWREELPLDGERFGEYAGRVTTMLCGGTLVFDETGNVLSWMRKPGSRPYGGRRSRTGQIAEDWAAAVTEGEARRRELLDYLAARIAARHVGPVVGSPAGLLGQLVRPMTVDDDGALLRFRLTPHMHLSEKAHLTTRPQGENGDGRSAADPLLQRRLRRLHLHPHPGRRPGLPHPARLRHQERGAPLEGR